MRALVIVACTLLVGCGRGENCFPGGQALQCASEGGTATIVPPAGYVTTTFVPPDGYVTTTILGVGSRTCLAVDGTCSARPSINATANFNNSNSSFGFMISLPAREGAATYALSSFPTIDDAAVQYGRFAYSADGVDMVPLIPLSGTVVVERSTTDAFLATFDLELESPDQRYHFSITAGRVEDTGCRVVSYGPHCQESD